VVVAATRPRVVVVCIARAGAVFVLAVFVLAVFVVAVFVLAVFVLAVFVTVVTRTGMVLAVAVVLIGRWAGWCPGNGVRRAIGRFIR
jgi:hypothetical protein